MKTILPVDASDVLGLAGAALVGSACWSLWGWEWAAIVLGAPALLLYVYGELRRATGPTRGGG